MSLISITSMSASKPQSYLFAACILLSTVCLSSGWAQSEPEAEAAPIEELGQAMEPVSYTHLTLPTK